MHDTSFNIKDLHRIQYGILQEFDRICKKFNLTYFLGFGSMLGAVRHSGFIPWDDDIDVLMLYDDLEKLKKIKANEWKEGYFLQSPETDKYYNKCFVKIRDSRTTLITDDFVNKDVNQGVAIDIEPLVGLADNPKQRRKQYRDTKLYMLLRYDEPPVNHGKLMYWGGKIILTLITAKSKEKLLSHYLSRVLSYNNCPTEYLYVVNGNVEMMRDLHKREWFKKTIQRQFEDGYYPVPLGYEEWLRTRYGNYMELPPEKDRGIKLNHFIKVDLNRPYSYYKGKYYCK